MCESSVFVVRDEEEELLMEDVAWIEVQNGTILLKDIMGRTEEVKGRIAYADLVQHHIVLEPFAEG